MFVYLFALANSITDGLDELFDVTNFIHNVFNTLTDFLVFTSSNSSRNALSGISESGAEFSQVSDALSVGSTV